MAFVTRLLWGTGRLTFKYVVVPIVLTTLAAAVLGELAERVRDKNELALHEPGNEHLAMAA